MAWIESHQSLGSHIKLKRLARELNIHRAQAIGHLHLLWWWSLDNAPSGNLSALSTVEIAEVSEWPGNVDKFVAALKACGWIDVDGCIHDWWEYAGKLVDQRVRDKERKRKAREAEKSAMSAGRPADVRRTGEGNPTDGGRTADVPNPTQPNPTLDAYIPPSARRSQSTFPSESEVETEADMRGIPKDVAQAFWEHFEAMGWVDKNGNAIHQWRPKLMSWWRKNQEDREKAKMSGKPVGGERREIAETINLKVM